MNKKNSFIVQSQPTTKPEQAIELLRKQYLKADDIEHLKHDDPKIDAWVNTTVNFLADAFGQNGGQHKNTNDFLYANGGPQWVGMNEKAMQECHKMKTQNRKALIEAYIEQLTDKICVLNANNHQPLVSLRSHLKKINSDEVRAFVEEALMCFESGCYRASVVLSWSGALGVLYNKILNSHLEEFNVALIKRFPKSKRMQLFDDFGLLKEHDFLEIACDISVIDRNCKTHLQNTCLKLRNSCGHPNTYKISEHSVLAHIEQLLLNVFER